ncbi:Uncharacterised protein [Mycobacteroides abscessus subsp. abscessus]|nr:Uncharacterised protein [Mycobacteroides abscessus subsp. abscessus]
MLAIDQLIIIIICDAIHVLACFIVCTERCWSRMSNFRSCHKSGRLAPFLCGFQYSFNFFFIVINGDGGVVGLNAC